MDNNFWITGKQFLLTDCRAVDVSKQSPYLKEELWNQAKWLHLVCWCLPSASIATCCLAKMWLQMAAPKVLQKAYASVDYVRLMLVVSIFCARVCWVPSRREMNRRTQQSSVGENLLFLSWSISCSFTVIYRILSSAAVVNKFTSDWEVRKYQAPVESWGASA